MWRSAMVCEVIVQRQNIKRLSVGHWPHKARRTASIKGNRTGAMMIGFCPAKVFIVVRVAANMLTRDVDGNTCSLVEHVRGRSKL